MIEQIRQTTDIPSLISAQFIDEVKKNMPQSMTIEE